MNYDETNDWAAYKVYVIEEIKDLKNSLDKLKIKVEDIRGLVIETKTKVIGLTVGIPTIISILVAAAQLIVGG